MTMERGGQGNSADNLSIYAMQQIWTNKPVRQHVSNQSTTSRDTQRKLKYERGGNAILG